MNIVVCDDDENILEYLSSLIINIMGKSCNVTKHNNGYALEIYLEEVVKGNIDILFTDIELGSENGIEVAKRIKKKFPHIKIIFITGFMDYCQNIFEAEPTYFIVKPIKVENLKNALDKAVKDIKEEKHKVLLLSTKGSAVSVKLKDIRYLESVRRKVIIHQTDSYLEVYCKLNEIEENLPANFIRCHQSYIVNMDKVKELNMYYFLMQDGEEISISQSRYNKTKEGFMSYLGGTI
ncbi:MAG: LytTR family DNA-binding domain-containing protein [Clostridium sp.]